MLRNITSNKLLAMAPITLVIASPVAAQERPDTVAPQQPAPDPTARVDPSGDVVVNAQRNNQTQVTQRGQVGVLGDKDAADVPFSIRSYNAALILNQQPQTLGQVLENDPTIRTTYGFGNAAEQFVIRGFTLYGDDVGFNGLYGISPRQLVAPELYDQVQVLNGASAFLNGAAPGGSGIGGSVNLVTKQAGAHDLARATVEYTQSGNVGGAVDLSHRFGGGALGVRFNGVYRSGDVSIDDEFRRTALAGLGVDYRGSAVRLTIDLDYQRIQVRRLRPKVTIASATIPAVPDAGHNYAQGFTYSNLRDIFGDARLEWDVAPGALLYVQGGARDGSERGIYDGITVTNAVTGAATGSALFVPRTDNNEALQGGLRVRLATNGVSNEFNIGGSYIWQVNRNAFDFRYGPGFAGFATNLYTTPQVALPSSTFVGGNLADPFPISRSRLGSLFASDTLGLLGDHVLITGGLRLQDIAVQSYSYYTNGSRTTAYGKDAVTPVAGVVIKPVAGVSLFFNRIAGLIQGPTAPVDATIINGGEVFAPYESTQYEAGGKVQLGRLAGSVAVYTTDQPNAYAVPDPQGSGLLRYGLYGTQRNRGIELTLSGEVVSGLRVIGGGSINDARLRNTAGGTQNGDRAQGVPTYLANADVEWDLPFLRGATLTGRVVQTGRQQVNAANTLALPAWTRGDVGARYVAIIANRPTTLRLSVDNVANNRYWASAFDSFSAALLQGAPRTVKASLSVDF